MVQIEVSRHPAAAPLQTASGVNLADVMACLEAHPALSPRQRREMVSALRTIARLMGTDLSAIPADPPGLRRRLEAVSPAAGGLSQGRWNNIRSLTLAALKHAGVQTMPGRSREPLLPAWETLRAGLPDATFRHGLSRFMSFCSAQQITPEAVDAAVFERFRAALDRDSLVKKTWTVYRTACVLWNRAGETLSGWPELVVAVPSASRRYALAWDDFPGSFRADAEAFLYRLGNQDPFADDYAAPAKASTVQMRRKQILQIATALTCSGRPAETITDLTVLVELDNAKQALRFFFDRAGGQSTKYLHQQALLIGTIARHWVKAKADHVQALGGICRRLAIKNTGMTDKNRARLRQFDDPANVDALLSLPRRVLRQVQREDRGLRRDALRVMLALGVEVLIVAPMRVNNLAGIDTSATWCGPASDLLLSSTW